MNNTKLFSIFPGIIMAVELEEIALFGLFTHNGKTIQLSERHFLSIGTLVKELIPIKLDFQKLGNLGFIRHSDGILFREQGECKFYLRILKNGSWEFSLNDGQRIRIVQYVHQVQRLWFDLFDDHLFIPKQSQDQRVSSIEKTKTRFFQRRH
jgi:hypothetical protein